VVLSCSFNSSFDLDIDEKNKKIREKFLLSKKNRVPKNIFGVIFEVFVLPRANTTQGQT